jgi:hypothetical protein
MAPKTLRPYIKSSIKPNLHIDFNSNPHCRQILEELGNLLRDAGFAKKIKEGKLKKEETELSSKQTLGMI